MKNSRKIVSILVLMSLVFQTTSISFGASQMGKQSSVAVVTPSAVTAPGIQKTGPLEGLYICVDPGHGYSKNKVYEFVAPTSKVTKRAFVSGTSGSKYSEAQINLVVGNLLKKKLEDMGAKVIMTRQDGNAIYGNAGRAIFANNAKVDLVVRVHCDGSLDRRASGASMLVPGSKYVKPEIAAVSQKMGATIFNSFLKATGTANRGVVIRDDLAGFNWTTVPAVLIEMGFMTNAHDDALLGTVAYQEKLATGLAAGIVEVKNQNLFVNKNLVK